MSLGPKVLALSSGLGGICLGIPLSLSQGKETVNYVAQSLKISKDPVVIPEVKGETAGATKNISKENEVGDKDSFKEATKPLETQKPRKDSPRPPEPPKKTKVPEKKESAPQKENSGNCEFVKSLENVDLSKVFKDLQLVEDSYLTVLCKQTSENPLELPNDWTGLFPRSLFKVGQTKDEKELLEISMKVTSIYSVGELKKYRVEFLSDKFTSTVNGEWQRGRTKKTDNKEALKIRGTNNNRIYLISSETSLTSF